MRIGPSSWVRCRCMEGLMILVRSGPEETGRVEEALRLAAAMLGFDNLLTLVFLDEGVRCLHTGAFSDPLLQDYLRASADLAGVHALTSGEEAGEDLDPALGASLIDLDRLMIMLKDFSAVASF